MESAGNRMIQRASSQYLSPRSPVANSEPAIAVMPCQFCPVMFWHLSGGMGFVWFLPPVRIELGNAVCSTETVK